MTNQLETIQKQFLRGLTVVPANLVEVPHQVFAREITDSIPADYQAGFGERVDLLPSDRLRFNRLAMLLMYAVVEPLQLAHTLPGDIQEEGLTSYGTSSILRDHVDESIGGTYVRLGYNVFGHAKFHSTVTGSVDLNPGDLLVQDLAKGVEHGISTVYDQRLIALWDVPALSLQSRRRAA